MLSEVSHIINSFDLVSCRLCSTPYFPIVRHALNRKGEGEGGGCPTGEQSAGSGERKQEDCRELDEEEKEGRSWRGGTDRNSLLWSLAEVLPEASVAPFFSCHALFSRATDGASHHLDSKGNS